MYFRQFLATLATCSAVAFIAQHCNAAEPGIDARLEVGAAFQERNKVQVPNDREGTRFSLNDIAGSGPWPAVRAELEWNVDERHGLRMVLAPFAYSERGRLGKTVQFEGESFSPDAPVRASYKFNSWRLGYRYNFYDHRDWLLWAGATLKVRDAQIELQQAGVRSEKDDIGLVPLLYLAARYRIAPDWYFAADFDGLAGGPGRAIDFSARVVRHAGDHWRFGVGYRTLEGGADTDDVYNFAWFNTAFTSLEYRF
ncbi:hypothetical protein [Haliea sp. E17]|uniref:hypothetical protein n=1 Tax=Haliea sp. E17 TaxID=3401576 RepID=UPI003AB0661B